MKPFAPGFSRATILLVAGLALVATALEAAARVREVRYQGTLELEAHFGKPGDTRIYQSEQYYQSDGRGRVRLDWISWAEGDTVRLPETFLLIGEQLFHRSDPAAPWRLLIGERGREGRLQTLAGLPQELERRTPRPRRALGPRIERQTGRPRAFVELRAHPRLGDVADSIAWTYGKDPAPETLRMSLHERDQQWTLTQSRVAWGEAPGAESLFAAPEHFDPPPVPPDSLRGEPVLTELAPGVWSADMEDLDSRSLIVEFADHLALIEIAVGSSNGERLVDAAIRRWPQKPIRQVFFSHYHPHYSGGLRAAIATGATVITTPGNEAFVRRLAALPFRLEPDRLARSPRPLSLRTFSGRLELADSSNHLVAIDYGARSQHTDEFVIFWLPRAKLLFEAELGWVKSGDQLRASRRAKPLLDYLATEGIEVERLVQSWPMRGNAPTLSRNQLQALVDAARP